MHSTLRSQSAVPTTHKLHPGLYYFFYWCYWTGFRGQGTGTKMTCSYCTKGFIQTSLSLGFLLRQVPLAYNFCSISTLIKNNKETEALLSWFILELCYVASLQCLDWTSVNSVDSCKLFLQIYHQQNFILNWDKINDTQLVLCLFVCLF